MFPEPTLGPLTAIAGDVITRRTRAFFVCVITLLSLMPEMRTRTPHRIPGRGFSPHSGCCKEFVWWSAASSWTVSLCRSLPGKWRREHSASSYHKDPAEGKTVLAADDLETHDSLFKKYNSFHRLSGEQDRDARTSAYRDLILSQTFSGLQSRQPSS